MSIPLIASWNRGARIKNGGHGDGGRDGYRPALNAYGDQHGNSDE